MTTTGIAGDAHRQPLFPFSAVVGHEDVKLALLLNAVDPRIGGVLLRGEKGSAKSTLARSLAGLLPGPARFVDLPVSASEDRVVGSIDLSAALAEGVKRFHPGLLALADGGVLYIDEINLLPDHLVDVLLDVAASGVNRVERESMSETHSSRFVLVGSMNPEEGDLRPQLLDRFGLTVDVHTSNEVGTRVEAVQRRRDFDHDPNGFMTQWAEADAAVAAQVAEAAPAEVPRQVLERISQLCVSVGAEGLRADLVMGRAAAALAGLEARSVVDLDDVRRVAPLVLAHRRRRSPFDDTGIDQNEIDDALGEHEHSPSSPPDNSDAESGGGGEAQARDPAAANAPSRVVPLSAPRTTTHDAESGRRTTVESPRGRLIGERAAQGPVSDLAMGATVRAAALRRATHTADPDSPPAPLILVDDLRQAVREQKVGNLLILAVDASASMGVERRMEAVKGAVLSLLLDAYQCRDRVALITFHGDAATVALRPTASVEVARTRLADVATGGRTPLAAGIEAAIGTAAGATDSHRPLVILISDGRATAGSEGADPLQEAMTAAARVRSTGIASVVIDVEDGDVRLGLSVQLAEAMGARYLPLPELSAGALTTAIRQTVDQ
jgi:magnesium chelatase subunit D